MRSASFVVCWSPSITATESRASRARKRSIVAHSSVVLPEPGLETRLSASTPCWAKRWRFSRAMRSFAPSTSCSMRSARSWLMPGTETRAAPVP